MATALPAKSNLTGASVSEAGFKNAVNSLIDYLTGLLGADGQVATALSTLGAPTKSYVDNTSPVPAGSKTVWTQSAAPTGWTQDTSINDRVIRIVSGSGGGTGGNWTLSGMSIGSYTLTTADIPAHSHSGTTGSAGSHTHSASTGTAGNHNHAISRAYDNSSAGGYVSASSGRQYINASTSSAGNHTHSVSVNSAGAHTHSFTTGNTGGGGGHTHSLSNASWRPAYVDHIVASKDTI